jgi:outer membrane protein assembly factor BamA
MYVSMIALIRMKTHLQKAFLISFLFPVFIFGQAIGVASGDSTKKMQRYSLGVIPVAAFDSDLGLKYGGVFNLFDHGKSAAAAQNWQQHLFLRLTNTTKGTTQAQMILESESLIKTARLIFEVNYLNDRNFDFFGFNGHNAIYHPELTDDDSPLFTSKDFYASERRLFRVRLDMQHYLTSRQFRLLTGYMFNNYEAIAGNQEITGDEQPMEAGNTLLQLYNHWGIIRPEERRGGNIHLFSLGVVYDTRNDHCFCTDGKWLETYFLMSPHFMSDAGFSKWIFTYRQHKSFLDERLTISARLSSQQKLWGNIPFYILPTYYDSRMSQDGLGGAFNLRGALRNRVVADGFVTGTFETKFRIMELNLLRQHFFVSLAVFYDNAFVTQPYAVDLTQVPHSSREMFFDPSPQKLHHTFGPGLYIVWNQNNIITVNYGIPASPQDGTGGLYVGSALLF